MSRRKSERKAAAEESVRMLRFQLRPVLDEQQRSLMITSPYRSAEKSRLVFSLGQLLWKEGHKVLVVEADGALRAIPWDREVGLDAPAPSSGEGDPRIECVQLDGRELQGDEVRMRLARWAALYDSILVNGPPLLEEAHAAALASCCDATLLLVESGKVGMRDLELTRTLLDRAGASLVGSVLASVGGRP